MTAIADPKNEIYKKVLSEAFAQVNSIFKAHNYKIKKELPAEKNDDKYTSMEATEDEFKDVETTEVTLTTVTSDNDEETETVEETIIDKKEIFKIRVGLSRKAFYSFFEPGQVIVFESETAGKDIGIYFRINRKAAGDFSVNMLSLSDPGLLIDPTVE